MNLTPEFGSALALPFLKWPGGKRWLAPELARFINGLDYDTYFEPFLGGGAVFFATRPARALLSDVNDELTTAYRTVKEQPKTVISLLKGLQVEKGTYDSMREQTGGTDVERCVRFLYLNRLAFGGMYRVNKKGQFNVPYGGGERGIDILWRRQLIATAAQVLDNAEVLTLDFSDAIARANSGDLVYCDPTYTVAHNDNAFRRYNENIFSWSDQERLHASCLEAVGKGVTVVVSNAAHHDIAELYAPWQPYTLQRASRVSRKPTGRRNTTEFLFVLTRLPGVAKYAEKAFEPLRVSSSET